MRQVDGIFGGESSGHYFFREAGYAESPIPVILLVLKVMTEEGRSLSELAKGLKRSEESGEINFKVANAMELMRILESHFEEGQVERLDGVAVSFPEWRFSLRSSNTEPLLRLNIEELEMKEGQSRKEDVIKLIKTHARYS